MEKQEMMYEGKAKQVYASEDPNLVIIHYKDDATAFNGLKKASISNKGHNDFVSAAESARNPNTLGRNFE